MRKFNKKIIPIYCLLIIYIVFSTFYGYRSYANIMINIINPLFYITTFIILLFLSNSDNKQRVKAKTNKYKLLFIIVIT